MEALKTDDPTRIGGYRLLGRLGEGGMGRVYLARSDRGRTVAVKVVQAELARQSDFRQRFAQEVRAAQRVGDQWTAPVLDADTDAETPWVATGYVAGPSLAEVVGEQYGPLPETSVRALALGLVRALQAIHAAGLVHRDLKPSNVLVTIEGPRVIDFGIARALDAAVQSAGGLTRTGALVGSPGFMSPEQVRGQHVTPASDVFCLGTVLAYAATGRLPFGTVDSGLHALLFRIAEEDADLGGIPQPWQGLIAACLAKAPDQRPTVDTLLESIEATEHAPGADLGQAWLPAAILARLGQHAVALLDSEDPQRFGPPDEKGPGPGTGPVPAAVPVPGSVPGPSTPTPGAAPGATPGVGAFGAAPPAQAQAQAPSPSPVLGQVHGAPWRPAGPVAAGAAQHSTPPPRFAGGPGVRSVRPTAAVVNVLLALFALASAAHLFALIAVSASLSDERSDTYLAEIRDLGAMQGATMAAEVATGLGNIAVIIAWLFWFRRTRLNAEVIAPGAFRDAPGFAVGSWFIPFANLALPKRIANDIWRACEPGRPVSRALLQAWWILWLCMLGAHLAAEALPSWYDTEDVGAAEAPLGFAQLAPSLGVVASIVAIFFVNRLTSLQEARLSNRGPLAAGS